MIHTIVSNGHLYRVNRDRAYLQDKHDKRRTFWLVVLLFTVITIGVFAFILQTNVHADATPCGKSVITRLAAPRCSTLYPAGNARPVAGVAGRATLL